MADTIDYFGQQTDEDLAAIYTYLKSLPALEAGY
jgi:hypothetical protein